MARLQAFQTLSGVTTSPQAIACPTAWRRAEVAIIRLSISARNPNIGKIDIKQLIPRQWTGYYYLSRANCVREHGSIEFKNQEIYNNKHLWQAELFTQSYINELTTPDADLNELIDEGSMALALAGSEFLPSLTDLNIPLLDPILEFIEGQINNLASDNIHYYPMPDRPDKLWISFRDGYATIRYEFLWIPYSPLLIAGGLAELSIEPEIENIDPHILGDLDLISDPMTFEDEAIARGYIPASGLAAACSGSGFQSPAQSIRSAISAARNSAGNSDSIYQEILNKLLEDGSITQAQIDAIKAINPAFSPKDVLDYLGDNGIINPEQAIRAIAKTGNASPSQSILNNGNFSSVGGQYCLTGKPLRIVRDTQSSIEMEYLFSGSASANCAVYPDNANLNIRMLSSIFRPAKTIYLRKYSGENNTGNYSLINVTGTAKIIEAPSFSAFTLGGIVWRRGNVTTNTEGILPSELDP